jgi:hypothetical protein
MRARSVVVSLVALCAAAVSALACGSALAQAAPVQCPNAAIRAEQHAALLPDCRAYERVSPEDKGSGDIVADGETSIAATGGGAVAFSSRTPFGDEIGSGWDGQLQYVARRNEGGTGWVTHAVTPAPKPEAFQTSFTVTKLQLFSDDLRTALVWGYDLPGGGGEPYRNNIYAEDTATRALQPLTVSQDQSLNLRSFQEESYAGISADARHLAFTEFFTKLLPIGELKEFTQNVYQSDNGVLSLAGILPDGSVPANGSEPAVPQLGESNGGGYRGAMSADGSRLLFLATPNENRQLYMRVDGERTVRVSEPENGETFEPSGVQVQYMTPDGRNVFFVTSSKLLSEDENEGPDLYRWTYGPDPEHERNLTLITNTGELSLDGLSNGVVGVSDDGSRVYYQTMGSHLFVWDNGATRLISSDAEENTTEKYSLAAIMSGPGLGRVSPDGMWLAFLSAGSLNTDGIHALTGQPILNHSNGTSDFEVYLYSLKDEQLTCVSCPSAPASSYASVLPEVTNGDPKLTNVGIRPQFLSDDGRVFFSTAEALLPQDTNGVTDVYEYDGETGTLSLLSPGTGSEPTTFADASASGEDVFVQTHQQLVAEDRDSLVDMYDVRAGGGFPAPPAAPAGCGTECQPPPSGSPPFAAPTTAGIPGSGNLLALVTKPVVRSQSNARKLAGALRACRRKRHGAARKRCVSRVRRRYGGASNGVRGAK